MKPLVDVKDLEVSFLKGKQWNAVLHGISFEIYPNEVVGMVGESGSGKSVSSYALMGLLPDKMAKISRGNIWFNGKDISSLSKQEWQNIRGKEMGMVFQEPMSALNPSMRCGNQVMEVLLQHFNMSKKEATQQVLDLFEKVKLPDPQKAFQSYPHQLSGGQKQRIVIAMAIACKPKLIIADEPTTALDVTVQKEIISLLKSLQTETGMSLLFITHDLSLMADVADRTLVMYKGTIEESGNVKEVLNHPQKRYTQALLASRPPLDKRLFRLPTIKDFMNDEVPNLEVTHEERSKKHVQMYSKPPILEVRNVFKNYSLESGFFKKSATFQALKNVSFKMYEGETLGLVGESGCGKSTLGNAILMLDPPDSGQILYRGKDLLLLNNNELRKLRKEIQIIFQDPFASLNPHLRVGEAISEPMLVHKMVKSKSDARIRTKELLERVGLSEDSIDRYPHEFSGGQRQRIGIARAIAVHPQLIVCDESVSALDISVQAQVLNLLNELKEEFGFSYLFISHDLSVVKYMSDQVMVLYKGEIEELEEADELFAHPKSGYTKKLIASIPGNLNP